MPHDVMNSIHETGMPDSYHWLFWVVVVAVFVLLLLLVWRIGNSPSKPARRNSGEKPLDSSGQKNVEKERNDHE